MYVTGRKFAENPKGLLWELSVLFIIRISRERNSLEKITD